MISTSRLTARTLINGMQAYLQHRSRKKENARLNSHVRIRGKQTVKQLISQDQGVSNVDISKTAIRGFGKIAQKYGIDYAIKKDRSVSPEKYLVFFRSKDADAFQAAYKEYAASVLRKQQKKRRRHLMPKRPSIRKQLAKFKAMVAALPVKAIKKDREQEHDR